MDTQNDGFKMDFIAKNMLFRVSKSMLNFMGVTKVSNHHNSGWSGKSSNLHFRREEKDIFREQFSPKKLLPGSLIYTLVN